MARGQKTGGRTKGTPNKRTAAEREAIKASGETPLEYALRIMRDPSVDHERRDKLAVAAMAFVHPRLESVDSTIHGDQTIRVVSAEPLTADEWEHRYGDDGVGSPAKGAN